MAQQVYEDNGFIMIEWNKGEAEFDYDIIIGALEMVEEFIDPKTGEVCRWSQVISDLLSKTWIEKETLYRIAQITDSNFPGHSINWLQTFKMVERSLYYDAIDIHEEAKLPEDNGLVKYFHGKMIAGMYRALDEDEDGQTQESLNQVVINNIEKFGLN